MEKKKGSHKKKASKTYEWKWQPTSVFLPGESQGQRSLVGCRLWCCTERLSKGKYKVNGGNYLHTNMISKQAIGE